MRHLNTYILLISCLLFTFSACRAQDRENPKTQEIIGGPCQGCEAIFEYGNKELSAVDTLPGFQENKPNLKLTGIVFEKDGKTPAENVILYIYHTNRQGIYEKKGDEKGWAKKHGYIRGWTKTSKDGKYTFLTFRPAAYPNRRAPEHIHITVKEPDKNEYYIEDYLFEDDPLLTTEERKRLKSRGGSGIVLPKMEKGILLVQRDIVLGKNIPDYE